MRAQRLQLACRPGKRLLGPAAVKQTLLFGRGSAKAPCGEQEQRKTDGAAHITAPFRPRALSPLCAGKVNRPRSRAK